MGAYTHSRMRQMILGGVTSHVMTAASVRAVAKVVREKWQLRELIKSASRVLQMAYDAADDATVILDEAERSDRLLLMREGRILAQGSPAAIKERAGVAAETLDLAGCTRNWTRDAHLLEALRHRTDTVVAPAPRGANDATSSSRKSMKRRPSSSPTLRSSENGATGVLC